MYNNFKSGIKTAKEEEIKRKLSDPNFLNNPEARKELASALIGLGQYNEAAKLAFPETGAQTDAIKNANAMGKAEALEKLTDMKQLSDEEVVEYLSEV